MSFLLGLGFAVLTAVQDPSPAPAAEAEFRQLHRALVPVTSEPWQQIPWCLELLPAAAAARAEGKRLFVWSMNGHPLGCT